jgi:hypothetical protein
VEGLGEGHKEGKKKKRKQKPLGFDTKQWGFWFRRVKKEKVVFTGLQLYSKSITS